MRSRSNSEGRESGFVGETSFFGLVSKACSINRLELAAGDLFCDRPLNVRSASWRGGAASREQSWFRIAGLTVLSGHLTHVYCPFPNVAFIWPLKWTIFGPVSRTYLGVFHTRRYRSPNPHDDLVSPCPWQAKHFVERPIKGEL